MNCKYCSALYWHPNKGFYCTVPNCNPETRPDDVREIYEKIFGSHEQEKKQMKQEAEDKAIKCREEQ